MRIVTVGNSYCDGNFRIIIWRITNKQTMIGMSVLLCRTGFSGNVFHDT